MNQSNAPNGLMSLPIQKTVRIQQWESREHDVHQARTDLPSAGLLEAPEQFGGIDRHRVLEQVGMVQLGEDLDHRLLTERRDGESLKALFPDIFHGPVRS
jgi:hypothetical protein